jgi:hypothetical protein
MLGTLAIFANIYFRICWILCQYQQIYTPEYAGHSANISKYILRNMYAGHPANISKYILQNMLGLPIYIYSRIFWALCQYWQILWDLLDTLQISASIHSRHTVHRNLADLSKLTAYSILRYAWHPKNISKYVLET